MTTTITAVNAKASLATLAKSLERGTTSLQQKSSWLRQHRSTDPIQQMQTDAIVELCEVVRQLQQAMSTLPLIIPDVQAVRDAAAKTTVNTTTFTAYKRP